MRKIRTATRAIIIHENNLLAIKMRDRSGEFYLLPGGGQNHGETLKECLIRECYEELGVQVRVDQLLYMREYIGKNHQFRSIHGTFHQVESVFRCHLSQPDAPFSSIEKDKKQVGIEWLPLAKLSQYPLLPSSIKAYFSSSDFSPPEVYLGDTN
jgi:8-oxo-dGTP pyrophosphatase MutT (NUDIX family)